VSPVFQFLPFQAITNGEALLYLSITLYFFKFLPPAICYLNSFSRLILPFIFYVHEIFLALLPLFLTPSQVLTIFVELLLFFSLGSLPHFLVLICKQEHYF